MEEEIVVKEGTEDEVRLTKGEYEELLAQKERLEEVVAENLVLKQKLNKLEVEIRHKGSMAEAGRLAVLIQEFNDLLYLSGRETITFSPEEQENLRSVIISKVRELVKDEALEYVFSDNEDLALVMKNLRSFVQKNNIAKLEKLEAAASIQIAKG